MLKWIRKYYNNLPHIRAKIEQKEIEEVFGENFRCYNNHSSECDDILLSIMDLEQHQYKIIDSQYKLCILTENFSYELWNENRWGSWLCNCTQYIKGCDDKHSRRELWNHLMPSKLIMARFYKWLYENSHSNMITASGNYRISDNDIFYKQKFIVPEELFRI